MGKPNWLLRGVLAVSFGIHALILVHVAGSYKPNALNYIELEIRADEKPAARNLPIPVPDRETEPPVAERVIPIQPPEPVAAPLPAVKPVAVLEPAVTERPQAAAPEEASAAVSADARVEVPVAAPVGSDETETESTAPSPSDSLDDEYESYYQKVLEKIETNKKYPYAARKLKAQGRVLVQFIIEADGTARNVVVAETASNRLLDKAALAAVTASSPFAKPPPELFSGQVPLEVGVGFQLNNN